MALIRRNGEISNWVRYHGKRCYCFGSVFSFVCSYSPQHRWLHHVLSDVNPLAGFHSWVTRVKHRRLELQQDCVGPGRIHWPCRLPLRTTWWLSATFAIWARSTPRPTHQFFGAAVNYLTQGRDLSQLGGRSRKLLLWGRSW